MSLTDHAKSNLLDHLLANNAYTSPGSHELGLFTASPGDGGSTTNELGDSNYARQSVSFDASVDSGGPYLSDNTGDVTFPTIDDASVTISHFAVFDGSGNMLWYGAFDSSKTADVGDTPVVSAGDLDLELD